MQQLISLVAQNVGLPSTANRAHKYQFKKVSVCVCVCMCMCGERGSVCGEGEGSVCDCVCVCLFIDLSIYSTDLFSKILKVVKTTSLLYFLSCHFFFSSLFFMLAWLHSIHTI
jgi:hypothetical protein